MLTKRTLAFLADLEKNNNKAWFDKNKDRFEEDAREPFRALIRELEPRLHKISPHILASDKKVGGAMMRINRDVRFSKDKRPYDPRLAARFVHDSADKRGAPGFYLRVDHKGCWVGTGIWQPDTPFVKQIRDHIVAEPKAWKSAVSAKAFRDTFGDLDGESLKRPPKGYDPEHPLVEDLKRKDFVGFAEWKANKATGKTFVTDLAKAYRSSNKLMAFLCDALKLPY